MTRKYAAISRASGKIMVTSPGRVEWVKVDENRLIQGAESVDSFSARVSSLAAVKERRL